MLLQERINSLVDAIRRAIQGELKTIYTAMPVIVAAASDGQKATLQPSVTATITDDQGNQTNQPFPQLIDAPVHFTGGGGVTNTHPVATGDEGIAIVMRHNQDGWFQSGGIQNPVDSRQFDLSDSRYVPGGRSMPRALSPAASTTSAQSRSDDGNHVSDVHPMNGITHASTAKVVQSAGTGAGASQTINAPGQQIQVAGTILQNCSPGINGAQPGAVLVNNMAPMLGPPPAIGPQASMIDSILSSVVAGGAAAVLANPIASAVTSLSGALTTGAAAVTSALGSAGAPLVAALTGGSGLQAALGPLNTSAGQLSGATSGGTYGLPDILNHAAMVNNYFGSAPPSGLDFPTAAGPILSGPSLATMESQSNTIVAAVIAGSMTVAAGTTAIEALTTQASAIVPASTSALSGLQAAAPALAIVAQAGAAVNSFNPLLGPLMSAMTAASAPLAQLGGAFLAACSPSPATATAMTTFPDPEAAQPGAQGGL